jgi:hypothetical protein
MTQRRATAPGPRTVAPHRVHRFVAGHVLLALLVAACGASSIGPSRSPGAVGGSAGPALGPGAPGASLAPDATPLWPAQTVLAVMALGAADGEIQKAGDDLQAAAGNQDLKAMWGAADGLAKMIDGLMPNIDGLELYAGTKPAAVIYRKAFPELSAGAKQLRDAITDGNANGIVAGSQAIAQGLADYAPVRQLLGGLVEQAVLQQRLLVK